MYLTLLCFVCQRKVKAFILRMISGKQPTAGFDFAQPARDKRLRPERSRRVQSRTVRPFLEIA
jgi:hypothetical protein